MPPPSFPYLPHLMHRQDMMCTFVQTFPMLEAVHAIEGKDGVGAELVHSLCKARSTLRSISVQSGSLQFGWTADAVGEMDDHSD
jgi:hypothetical protein